MRKAWFAWEHNSRGYSPVIYYDELPNIKTAIEKGSVPKIAASYDISNSQFMSDVYDEVAVSFKELEAIFPRPIDPVEPKFSLPTQEAAE